METHNDDQQSCAYIENEDVISISKEELLLFDTKVENAVAGLHKCFHKLLVQNVSKYNAIIITNYIHAMKTETNLSDKYRISLITTLSKLSRYHNHKPFTQMTRGDVITYLDSLRKPETSDPLHKWIGTYNLYSIHFIRFFKWLYHPNIEQDKRPKPTSVENIPKIKRKEQSIYKPTDLWTVDDDALFLKYCPDKRIKCYHTIARDSSCRPNEILKLRVKDIIFKTANNAEVLVNGKTGSRHIPLINSIPYLKDWLDDHPQQGNSNSFLILTKDRKNFGRKMTETGLRNIYNRYKVEFFPKLREDSNIPAVDKQKITELIKKPWNPYIRRHSAITEKSKVLKEHVLRQHCGWSVRSHMPQKYLHYYGNESSESLLEAYGIVTKDKQFADALRPKPCPNCNEPNKPDAKFCAKCRMVLTYDGYNETLKKQQEKDEAIQCMKEKYDSDIALLKDAISDMQQLLKNPEKLIEISKAAAVVDR